MESLGYRQTDKTSVHLAGIIRRKYSSTNLRKVCVYAWRQLSRNTYKLKCGNVVVDINSRSRIYDFVLWRVSLNINFKKKQIPDK